ncbi:MAG TPA: thiamine phosphate synthase [Silvibacterium sp.]|nr:thiamine phosphate synthase [Silvibacterium sp.]
MGPWKFPPLYPILDAGLLPRDLTLRSETLAGLIPSLAEAGVGILQYHNKQGDEAEILRDAEAIRSSAPPSLMLILNDYAEVVSQSGFHGVHLGQADMAAGRARDLLGPEAMIGLSTHNEAQLRAALEQPVDYIAIGPVFATSSKANPDPVIGLDGVRLARRLSLLPVIAIGGITPGNAAAVWGAGADSVAVISAIFGAGVDAAKSAAAFLREFERLQPSVH